MALTIFAKKAPSEITGWVLKMSLEYIFFKSPFSMIA